MYLSQNGTQLVVFGTGGETHSGGLFVIQLKKLIQGLVNQAIKIASKKGKGIFFYFFFTNTINNLAKVKLDECHTSSG